MQQHYTIKAFKSHRIKPKSIGFFGAFFLCALIVFAVFPLYGQDFLIQTQHLAPANIATPAVSSSLGGDVGFRRVELNPRSDAGIRIAFEPYDRNNPTLGGIVVLTGGINLILEGIADPNVRSVFDGDTVDISADNAVIWTENPGKLHSGASFVEADSLDFEIYLEGNIIYRDGPRVIQASRMYYDVKHKVGYITQGHLFIPIGDITGVEGAIRLRAEVLQKRGDGIVTARNAMVTASQIGEPTYSLHSQTLRFDGFASDRRQIVVAENNYIALRSLPVFYWPWIATDVENPTFFLKNIAYGNSGRTGNSVKTLWDPFQILNIRKPNGVDGDVNVSWLEKRGIAHGGTFRYNTPNFGMIPCPTKGRFVYWGIDDKGTDQLGGERKNIGFPDSYRYRVHWKHQQTLNIFAPFIGGLYDFRAEVGKVSDRNFLNSYFNSVWHTEENATTALDLTRRDGNIALGISAEYALDEHYSNTNWLPKLDHFWLGQSLLADRLTWYEHTRVGYADNRVAALPTDEVDLAHTAMLPWEMQDDGEINAKQSGLVFSTRHELNAPLQLGPFKAVPYILGDFSYWEKDQTGQSVDRAYGQAGLRVNLPIWKVNPGASSRTWYLNGLAHKIDLDAEYFFADANRNMDRLILTSPIDNWSIDDFRRRYLMTNVHFTDGEMPAKFDPRFYALRSGLAGNVTAGNMEIADDLQMLRVGMTHRFQTKRGSVGRRNIMDWITFSTHLNIYPDAEDNFGEHVGLVDYNVLWHVGDRFSLFSEGLYDFFSDGQKLTRFGGIWNRPERGSFSLMLDQFSGIIERTYLSASISYAMNEKYSASYMTSYDLRDGQNVGHHFTFIRTGESFRLLMGAAYSEALSEWNFSVGFEPVFLRRAARNTSFF